MVVPELVEQRSFSGSDMAGKTIILGIAQMRESSHLGRNLWEIAQFAEAAAAEGADILCFPECALTGYGPAHHESPADFDPDAVEAGLAEVRVLARRLGMTIAIGAHMPLDGGWTNSVLLIRSDGRIVTRYDKAHLYGLDAEFYRAGRERAEAATVKGVRIGLQICFDIRFPEPFRRLAIEGAQIILVPSHIHGKSEMWKGPVIASHVSSRAAEDGRFVAFVNSAGSAQNAPSTIANPRGEIVLRGRRGAQQILLAELDLRQVNEDFLSVRRTDLF